MMELVIDVALTFSGLNAGIFFARKQPSYGVLYAAIGLSLLIIKAKGF